MSFVTTLTIEHELEVEEVEDPVWEDVEGAIDELDGKTITTLTLAPARPMGPPEGDHHMAIGGGKDGLYIVYLTEDNALFWNLEDPTKQSSTRRIMMVTGGQEGDFHEAQCVPKEWAMRAAKVYFELGMRAADLPWTEG